MRMIRKTICFVIGLICLTSCTSDKVFSVCGIEIGDEVYFALNDMSNQVKYYSNHIDDIAILSFCNNRDRVAGYSVAKPFQETLLFYYDIYGKVEEIQFESNRRFSESSIIIKGVNKNEIDTIVGDISIKYNIGKDTLNTRIKKIYGKE